MHPLQPLHQRAEILRLSSRGWDPHDPESDEARAAPTLKLASNNWGDISQGFDPYKGLISFYGAPYLVLGSQHSLKAFAAGPAGVRCLI